MRNRRLLAEFRMIEEQFELPVVQKGRLFLRSGFRERKSEGRSFDIRDHDELAVRPVFEEQRDDVGVHSGTLTLRMALRFELQRELPRRLPRLSRQGQDLQNPLCVQVGQRDIHLWRSIDSCPPPGGLI